MTLCLAAVRGIWIWAIKYSDIADIWKKNILHQHTTNKLISASFIFHFSKCSKAFRDWSGSRHTYILLDIRKFILYRWTQVILTGELGWWMVWADWGLHLASSSPGSILSPWPLQTWLGAQCIQATVVTTPRASSGNGHIGVNVTRDTTKYSTATEEGLFYSYIIQIHLQKTIFCSLFDSTVLKFLVRTFIPINWSSPYRAWLQVNARLRAYLLACLLACMFASLLACFHACLPA